ncbi:MAG TPA: TIGR03118 family protein [Opitutaceae bacterium]|nr:TIGR03118 family protein [Opitutaceae bacterium]
MRDLSSSLALTCLTFCLSAQIGYAESRNNLYTQKILVANRPGLADGALIDQHLINPWGIALRPPGAGGHIWISNAGNASTSTFVGDANGVPLHQDGLKLVALDGPLVSYEDGVPNVTGQVYNIASDFPDQPLEFPVKGPASNLAKTSPTSLGVITGPAKFVFVTTDGTINAWRSSTSASMDSAVIVKDYSEHGPDQIRTLRSLPAFTGVAMSANAKGNNRLYVADFQNRTIRVLDNHWVDITEKVPFARPAGLPANYSPFNIQLLEGRLYVAFAALDVNAEEPATDVPGAGVGRIVAYDLDGKIIQDFGKSELLNSPWGVAIAPKNFGPFSGTLLVGNFGDGTMVAYDLATGKALDYLREASGEPIAIDGLWGIAFGNGVSLGDSDSLYFAAGPNLEQDGIFGRVRYSGPPRGDEQATPSLTSLK